MARCGVSVRGPPQVRQSDQPDQHGAPWDSTVKERGHQGLAAEHRVLSPALARFWV